MESTVHQCFFGEKRASGTPGCVDFAQKRKKSLTAHNYRIIINRAWRKMAL
jgi:hypothetical protein